MIIIVVIAVDINVEICVVRNQIVVTEWDANDIYYILHLI